MSPESLSFRLRYSDRRYFKQSSSSKPFKYAIMYQQQILIGVDAVIQAFCWHVLNSSPELWGMHFASNSVAVHWRWIAAHLYEQQIFKGVFAVTQASCRPVLKSSPELWGMHFAKTSDAVHWGWVTAHLYEHQIFIRVIAVTQACCWPILKSSPQLWERVLPKPVLHCIDGGSLHTCMNSKSSQM